MNMKKIIGLSIAGVALVGLGDSVVRGQKGHGGGGGHPAPCSGAPCGTASGCAGRPCA